jgi:hypothetical protein
MDQLVAIESCGSPRSSEPRLCECPRRFLGRRNTDTVREWHEQALIVTVLGALALDGSPEWTTQELDKRDGG